MSSDQVLRLLVADDEPGIRQGASRALRGLKVGLEGDEQEWLLQVETAATGDEAQERLAAEPFDILLLDHAMPGCTGMEILTELQENNSETLTIMITAYASLDMAVRATKQGGFDFLAKPFTPLELRSVVTKAALHLLADRAAKRLAQEKQRVRFEFLSVLAHELKAPLGAVEGYLMLIDEDVVAGVPEDAKAIVGRCLKRLGGMRKLIYDLLDLTRIESGHKERVLEPVDLPGVAGRVLETFAPEAQSRDITMSIATSGKTVMLADEGELEIILNNLVSNAVKYNRPGGQVRVNIDGGDKSIQLAVRDTGIGMNPEELERLFGEFVRIRNERTRDIMGSGLGLSILRRLALLNGGDVNVNSVEGKGTTFTVTMPLKQEQAEVSETSDLCGETA